MAKRSRGSTRPGQRRPLQRSTRPTTPSGRPTTPSPTEATASTSPGGLTASEEARAAALESAIVAEERSAEAGRASRSAPPTEEAVPRGRAKAGGLAVTSAHEYDYVRRDLRRITLLAAVLLLVMFGIFFAVTASGTISF